MFVNNNCVRTGEGLAAEHVAGQRQASALLRFARLAGLARNRAAALALCRCRLAIPCDTNRSDFRAKCAKFRNVRAAGSPRGSFST